MSEQNILVSLPENGILQSLQVRGGCFMNINFYGLIDLFENAEARFLQKRKVRGTWKMTINF